MVVTLVMEAHFEAHAVVIIIASGPSSIQVTRCSLHRHDLHKVPHIWDAETCFQTNLDNLDCNLIINLGCRNAIITLEIMAE